MNRNRESKLPQAAVAYHDYSAFNAEIDPDISSGLIHYDIDNQVCVKYLRILKTAKELSSSVPVEMGPSGRQTI